MQNYKGNNTLLWIRFHHVLMDGMGLMALVFGLSDEARKGAAAAAAVKKKVDKKAPGMWKTILTVLYFMVASFFVLLKHLEALVFGKTCIQLKGDLGVEKCLHMAGGESMTVSQVKDAGKRLGNFTLNDVVLSAFAGAMASGLPAAVGHRLTQ